MEIVDVLKRLQAGEIDPQYAEWLLEKLDQAPSADGSGISFSHDDAYVSDHLVHGDRILLGVTYVGLAIQSLRRRMSGQESVCLKNVIFKSPVILQPGQTAHIHAEVSDSAREVVVYNRAEQAKQEIAVASYANLEPTEAGDRFPIAQMQQGAVETLGTESIYALDGQLGIWHGPSLKTLDQLHILSEHECLGELSVKLDDSVQMADWPMHPALLEGAVMSGIHLLPSHDRKPFVPISLRTVQVVRPLGRHAYSHVQLVKAKNDMLELQISLYDSNGELAVKVDGFVGRYFPRTNENEIDNVRLATSYAEQSSESEAAPQAVGATTLEKQIKAYIVSRLNRISNRDDFTAYSKKNFMELGLDSVQLLQLAKQMEEEINIELYPTLFFEYSNIGELAEYFMDQFPEQFASYLELKGDSHMPATSGQEDGMKEREAIQSLPPVQTVEPIAADFAVQQHEEADDDIAIIGMNGRLPGSANLDEFWEHLLHKRDLMKEIPKDHFDYQPWYDERPQQPDKLYCKHGSFIDDVAKFDAAFFGISPTEAQIMDPQLRKLLEVTHATFEDAGYAEKIRGTNTGYYVGACFHDYCFEMLKSGKRVGPYDGTGNAATMLSNYPSFHFDLKGPSLTVDTACSSSLVALHLACNAIRNNECEMAVVSGVNLLLSSWHYLYFCSTGVLSKSGRCHTFDDKGDGYVPGEAIIAMLLKPLKKARRDGDHIHAVIKASAINHGGHTPAITAPSVRREADVIVDAWKKAGVDPDRIDFIEAHGTGTKLGDPVEVNGIKLAFQQLGKGPSACAISSVKASIGHTEGAAGLAGVVRVILAMKHRTIPAMPKFEKLNPLIKLDDSTLVINREPLAWERKHGLPRMAGVSSFGFGGTYSHVVLEEHDEPPRERIGTTGPKLLVLSARTDSALRRTAEQLHRWLSRDIGRAETEFGDVCYTMNTGRRAFDERLAIVASDAADCLLKLSGFLNGSDDSRDFWRGKAGEEAGDQVMGGEEALPELARAWVIGHPIDWARHYKDGKHQIVSLPTYPFEGRDYWISFSELNKQTAAVPAPAAIGALPGAHPFVDGERADKGDVITFTARLEGTEFYLDEHLVHGKKILVGAALIEAAVKAAGKVWPGRPLRFKHTRWFKPVIVEGATVPISIAVNKRDGSIAVTSFDAGGPVVHFQIHFVLDGHMEQTYSPIREQEIRDMCTRKIGKEQLYADFKHLGLNLGKSFQVVDDIFYNEGHAVSYIDAEHGIHAHPYQLHPALLDGSFHILRAFYQEEKEWIHVPFSVGEIEVFDRLESRMIVYARNSERKQSGFNSFDLLLASPSGKVLAVIRDFVARKIKPEKVAEESRQDASSSGDQVYFFGGEWEPFAPAAAHTASLQGLTVAFVEDPALTASLYAEMGEAHAGTIVTVTKGDSFKKIKQDHYQLNPVSKEDHVALWKDIGPGMAELQTIVHLWSQKSYQHDPEAVREQMESGPFSYFLICQSLSQSRLSQPVHILYLYACGQDCTEPVYEALPGMAKSIAQENGKLRTHVIGYAREAGVQELASIIARESGQPEPEVLYQGRQRYRRCLKPLSANTDRPITEYVRERAVVIITGGLGSIGAAIGRYLAEQVNARLVLAGRKPAADLQDKSLLQELGEDCIYVSADVNSREGVRKIVQAAKSRYGEVNGVIHCAGIVKDGSFVFKSASDMEAVMGPKVFGALMLDLETRDEALDVFITVSSISALIGNAGQSDYAYANSFMDRLCALRNRQRERGLRRGKAFSINYPLWKNGGMRLEPAMEQALIEKLGMKPISHETGLTTLEYGLRNSFDQISVVEGMRSKIENYLNNAHWPDAASSSGPAFANRTDNANVTGLEKKLEKDLCDIVSKLVNRSDLVIQPELTPEQCGMDSIAYVEFTNQINEAYNLDVSPAILFANSSIRELAAKLVSDYPEAFRVAAPTEQLPAVAEEKPKNGELRTYQAETLEAFYQPFNPEADLTPRQVAPRRQEVAIIGMDGVFPGSPDLHAFWENLKQGKDLIGEIPKERWSWESYGGVKERNGEKTALKWGGFIQDVDAFDHQFFQITPREAEQMDPQQRLFMMMTWKAIEDSGYSPAELSGKKVGVFVGASSFDYLDLLRQSGSKVEAHTSIGNAHSIIANRVSHFLNLRGPSESIDTACSSSLVAIARAIESLRSGDCELAIAGGINLMLSPILHQSFNQAGMLSEDGRCKTFDRSANGYVRGEGGGVIILKRLDKAMEARDHIYAVVKEYAINHGGRSNTLTAPNPVAQAELLKECYEKASIDPATIQYIEAHGTGTSLGDAIEVEGLKQAFRALTPKNDTEGAHRPGCALGSVKTNLGHLEAAAGIAGLLKAVLALKHKQIPPHLHIQELNPELRLNNSPFYVPNALEEWQRREAGPRRAGVSSFGFGGTNAHVLLEEYPEAAGRIAETEEARPRIFPFSAKSEYSLNENMKRFAEYLERPDSTASLQEISYTLQFGRASLDVKAAIVATTRSELQERLRQFLNHGGTPAEGIFRGERGESEERSKWVSLFSDNTREEFLKLLFQNNEVEKVALLWSMGIPIRWELLYGGRLPRRVPLPTYAFSKDRHWIALDRFEPVRQDSRKPQPSAEVKPDTGADLRQLKEKLKEWVLAATKTDPAALDEDTELAAIGMDSILSMELIENIHETYGIRMYPNELLMNPTISNIAALLKEELANKREDPQAEEPMQAAVSSVSIGREPERSTVGEPPLLQADKPSVKADDQKIVYVLSSPRSGSTLLRTMLMGHSDIFAPPELMLLPYNTLKEWDAKLKGRKWVHFKDGLIESIKVLKNLTPDEAVQEVQSMVAGEYPVKDVYKLLQQWSNKRYVVDKTPPYAENVEILKRAELITPGALYIYLHRHPLSVMESLVRNRFHKMLGSRKEPWKFADEAWRISNQNIIEFLQTVPAERTKRIAYEEMVADPEAMMKDLSAWLGIGYESSMIQPYEGERMLKGLRTNSMSVGDPNFLKHRKIEAGLADAWKQNLDNKDKLSKETVHLANDLGYSLEVDAETTEIQEEAVAEAYELAPAQQTYFSVFGIHHRFAMVQAIRTSLTEEIDKERMDLALTQAVQAHPALTNKFFQVEGRWRQMPTEAGERTVRIVDAASWDQSEWEAKRNEEVEQAVSGLDPKEGKLIDLLVFAAGELQYEFVLLAHHLICDAVSTSMIWKELFDRYDRKLEGGEAEHGFKSYIAELKQYEGSDFHIDARDYWLKEKEQGAARVPVDFPDSQGGNDAASEAEAELFMEFRNLSEIPERGTLYHALSTALYGALAEWTNDSNVVVAHRLMRRALPLPGRYEQAVGWFAGDVPIHLTAADYENAADMLEAFKRKFSSSSSYATSYEILANQGVLPQAHTVGDVRLNFQPSRFNTLGEDDWEAGMLLSPEADRLYLLDCIVREYDTGLKFLIRYSENRHKQETVEAFAQRWISRMEEICSRLNQVSVQV